MMDISAWEEIKEHSYLAALDFFIFLTILPVIGATFAVSFALIPVITSALALSLLPQLMMTLIIFSPVIVSGLLLVHFSEFHWRYAVKGTASIGFIHDYLRVFLVIIFWGPTVEFNATHGDRMERNGYKKKFDQTGEAFLDLWIAYGLLTALTSLGLGIYLSQAILPTLIASIIAATSLPYGVVALFGVLAAAVLITLTHHLLTLPFRLISLALWARLWQKEQGYQGLFFRVFQIGLTLTGMALAAYASYLVFPMTVKNLLPLLPATTASFTAVLICAGLIVLTMSALPAVVDILRIVMNKITPSALTTGLYHAELKVRHWIAPPGISELDENLRKAGLRQTSTPFAEPIPQTAKSKRRANKPGLFSHSAHEQHQPTRPTDPGQRQVKSHGLN